MENSVLKILLVIFLSWAILASSILAYYYVAYNQLNDLYQELKVDVEQYQETIGKLETTLQGLKNTLSMVNESYNEILENYSVLLKNISKSLGGGYVSLVVDFGNGSRKYFKFYIVYGENNTVFDLLLATGLELDYTYYEEFDDIFVNCIAGVCGTTISNSSGRYWLLYLNTELSFYGAKKTLVYNADFVEWKYELVTW